MLRQPATTAWPTCHSSRAISPRKIPNRCSTSWSSSAPCRSLSGRSLRSTCGMKEGSEKVFGKGYNIPPVFKKRLNAKTLITTPNSDVIYALGYLDLKEDGPLVVEVPPGLQGI